MKALIIFLFTLYSNGIFSQRSFFQQADSLDKKRVVSVSAGIGTIGVSSMTGLWNVWYKNSESGKWKFKDDLGSWLQMDKAGHVYTAYKLNQTVTDMYAWAGLSKTPSLLLGAGYSFAFQSTLEVFDGFSSDWGFSWSDFGANCTGIMLYTGQQLILEEERIIPKFSSHPSPYASIRPQVLGSSYPERLIKDYNGQSYWLSFSPGTFIPDSKFPKWLCFSVGYSVDQKLVGDVNVYTDNSSGNTYTAQRQWLLSMDIDFSRLPIRRPWLKSIVKQFNYLKIPFPTIIISNDVTRIQPLYF
ncbi:MAG: DUF2279 domain-containing protein [Bacteroidetes bacterium]|nr:MAG: DUF2279 domain-containing protein [Bacteroidota bacterium]